MTVKTTDCGTSSIANWGKLAEEVEERLAKIARLQSIDCLGKPQSLNVVLRVAEGDASPGTATPTQSPVTPAPTISTPAPTISTPAPTISTPEPTISTPAPTISTTDSPTEYPTESTPEPTVSTPEPTEEPTVSTPEPTVSTPEPTASTPEPTASTPEPTASTPGPTPSTPQPTASTPGPTPATPAPAALNENFESTVSDWYGTANFGDFAMDAKQVVDNTNQRGDLDFATCPSREMVTCNADLCHWGCTTASTTDCGTSSLVNWRLLGTDVKERLGGLGYACLGNANNLNVVLVVDDPEGQEDDGSLVPRSADAPAPTPSDEPAPAPAPSPQTEFATTAKVTRDGDFVPRDFEGFPETTTDRNGVCTEHTVVYDVAVDLQMEYPGGNKQDCSISEQGNIDSAVASALNGNFLTTVPDWDGDVGFGPVKFDSSQEVDKTTGGRQRRTQEGRMLESTCKQQRGIDCKGDYCRWGCLLAPSTSCSVNFLTNWANLADDIKVALSGLNYGCLGTTSKLAVNLVVTDPNEGTGSVTRSGIDANELLDQWSVNRVSETKLDRHRTGTKRLI
eukprot:Sro343_g121910.1 ADAM metallopeptidase with thrombospondin type 1, motif (566) ;mRNA; r:11264-13035